MKRSPSKRPKVRNRGKTEHTVKLLVDGYKLKRTPEGYEITERPPAQFKSAFPDAPESHSGIARTLSRGL